MCETTKLIYLKNYSQSVKKSYQAGPYFRVFCLQKNQKTNNDGYKVICPELIILEEDGDMLRPVWSSFWSDLSGQWIVSKGLQSIHLGVSPRAHSWLHPCMFKMISSEMFVNYLY